MKDLTQSTERTQDVGLANHSDTQDCACNSYKLREVLSLHLNDRTDASAVSRPQRIWERENWAFSEHRAVFGSQTKDIIGNSLS